jgi:hypothetical protein
MHKYLNLSEYLKNEFGERIQKLPVDGGFSCPNRINEKTGCLFCSDKGSGEFTEYRDSITEQIEIQKKLYLAGKEANKFIAYFQNFSNTYGSINELRNKYDEALSCNGIVGLAIATRPDCINDDVLTLLYEYSKKTFIWIELGFQTSNENTVELINRGYHNKVFDDCVKKLNEIEMKTVVHIIFGLPYESEKDYINTVKYIQEKNIWGIKFHSLYIQYNSPMFEYYKQHTFHIITMDEYTDSVAESIKILNNKLVIHRLTGDCKKDLLYEPKWSLDKLSVISQINKKLK